MSTEQYNYVGACAKVKKRYKTVGVDIFYCEAHGEGAKGEFCPICGNKLQNKKNEVKKEISMRPDNEGLEEVFAHIHGKDFIYLLPNKTISGSAGDEDWSDADELSCILDLNNVNPTEKKAEFKNNTAHAEYLAWLAEQGFEIEYYFGVVFYRK